ncbi:MAG: MlaE family lipid ABC transporter permease subunit [Chitinivibrionales bacterium]|nr:MlaE family lipid ABC transporter permease subunit [Chitinivibrionales bacterium]
MSGLKQEAKSTIPADTIVFPDMVSRQWVENNLELLRERPRRNLYFDCAKTASIDSAGVSFIHMLQSSHRKAGYDVILRNISGELLSTIKKWGKAAHFESEGGQDNRSVFLKAGDKAVETKNYLIDALSMLVEILYWSGPGLLKKRDYRKGVLGEQMFHLGYQAVGIVLLLSFLIGLVIAWQSAIQLRTFGAGVLLAPMVGWGMIREFGPLMTAIILAARTGSATTAEIATMSVGEEIDALQTMGINPVQFVVMPKFWAITITMPALSMLASAIGILAGLFVAVTYLDVSANVFFSELFSFTRFKDFVVGFCKAVVFAWLIIWIGSYYGFTVKGGAEQVGRGTTACVVTTISVIILADAVFSFI